MMKEYQETNNPRSTSLIGSYNPHFMLIKIYLDRMRMIISPPVHFLSFTAGLASGVLYGVIKSSRYSLEK